MQECIVSQENLKRLQEICYEMLIEIDRICRKNKIQYSVDGGTLLGAVRHKGFIPWDDDVDVIFTRKEYMKFRKACSRDLDNQRFFLQDHTTDSNYRWGYAKLRRKNTVQVRSGQEHIKQHTGVFVDIFIVDNVPDHYLLRKMHHFVCFCIRKMQYSSIGAVNEKNIILKLWYRVLNMIPCKISFIMIERLAAITNSRKTKLVSHYTFPYPKRCKYGMPSSCFNAYIDMKFEQISIRVFKEYDLYLRMLYGDYMKLPPKEKRVSHVTYSELQLIDVDTKLENRNI